MKFFHISLILDNGSSVDTVVTNTDKVGKYASKAASLGQGFRMKEISSVEAAIDIEPSLLEDAEVVRVLKNTLKVDLFKVPTNEHSLSFIS